MRATYRHTLPGTLLLAVTLTACVGQVTGGDDTGGDDEPPTCEVTRSYVGFGGAPLEGSRPTLPAGADRMRIKPFGALGAEYSAALGLAELDTRAYAATFGAPPARWFSEPAASANTIYASFALAFDACTRHTATAANYAAAPTAELADTICRDLAQRAWHRAATDAEALACTTFAVEQTAPTEDPRRRWAYACAAVLTAAGFVAY